MADILLVQLVEQSMFLKNLSGAQPKIASSVSCCVGSLHKKILLQILKNRQIFNQNQVKFSYLDEI